MGALFKLTFQPSGLRGEVEAGETVLDAARRLGERLESACGGQKVCGKCRFQPREGAFSPVSKEEAELLGPLGLAEGYRLACAASPLGDAVVYLPEEARAGRQVVLGSGAARSFEVDPPVRKYYVELDPPGMDDPSADTDRLVRGLSDRYGLGALSVSYHVLKAVTATMRGAGWKVTATVRGGEVVRLEPGFAPVLLGAAFDVGTTTVAGYLVDLSTGETVATGSMTNPQVAFGEDVMSRISYVLSREGGAEEVRAALVEGLNGVLAEMAASAAKGVGVDDVMEIVLVGNTVMHHLALGLPVGHLGTSPFTPALTREMEFPAHDLALAANTGAYVYTLPLVGGFVGADHTAVLIAEAPYERDDVTLIVDLGTNGEISVGDSNRLVTASCATGPAFEGAQVRFGMRAAPGAIERVMVDPETLECSYRVVGRDAWSRPMEYTGARGICGSGIVDAVALMRAAGIINPGGSFDKVVDHPRLREGAGGPEYVLAWAGETAIGRDITVSASDVRAVLLAKAAVHAGVRILMSEFGADKVDRVVLAGAFGNYIDIDNATALGLLPPCGPGKAYPVGNAAGDGAKAALLSVGKRAEARKAVRLVEHVELSLHPMFEAEFVSAMRL